MTEKKRKKGEKRRNDRDDFVTVEIKGDNN